ncbi:hypothetical protein GQR58_009783 [Nymphon striatum]|nr:hypothetical protein GQR58_009783 [Nymphon striatum]
MTSLNFKIFFGMFRTKISRSNIPERLKSLAIAVLMLLTPMGLVGFPSNRRTTKKAQVKGQVNLMSAGRYTNIRRCVWIFKSYSVTRDSTIYAISKSRCVISSFQDRANTSKSRNFILSLICLSVLLVLLQHLGRATVLLSFNIFKLILKTTILDIRAAAILDRYVTVTQLTQKLRQSDVTSQTNCPSLHKSEYARAIFVLAVSLDSWILRFPLSDLVRRILKFPSFTRGASHSQKSVHYKENYLTKKQSSNFIRFGRGGNFLRFGRSKNRGDLQLENLMEIPDDFKNNAETDRDNEVLSYILKAPFYVYDSRFKIVYPILIYSFRSPSFMQMYSCQVDCYCLYSLRPIQVMLLISGDINCWGFLNLLINNLNTFSAFAC